MSNIDNNLSYIVSKSLEEYKEKYTIDNLDKLINKISQIVSEIIGRNYLKILKRGVNTDTNPFFKLGLEEICKGNISLSETGVDLDKLDPNDIEIYEGYTLGNYYDFIKSYKSFKERIVSLVREGRLDDRSSELSPQEIKDIIKGGEQDSLIVEDFFDIVENQPELKRKTLTEALAQINNIPELDKIEDQASKITPNNLDLSKLSESKSNEEELIEVIQSIINKGKENHSSKSPIESELDLDSSIMQNCFLQLKILVKSIVLSEFKKKVGGALINNDSSLSNEIKVHFQDLIDLNSSDESKRDNIFNKVIEKVTGRKLDIGNLTPTVEEDIVDREENNTGENENSKNEGKKTNRKPRRRVIKEFDENKFNSELEYLDSEEAKKLLSDYGIIFFTEKNEKIINLGGLKMVNTKGFVLGGLTLKVYLKNIALLLKFNPNILDIGIDEKRYEINQTIDNKSDARKVLKVVYEYMGYKVIDNESKKINRKSSIESYLDELIKNETKNNLKKIGITLDIENKIIDFSKMLHIGFENKLGNKSMPTFFGSLNKVLFDSNITLGAEAKNNIDKKVISKKSVVKEILKAAYEHMGYTVVE